MTSAIGANGSTDYDYSAYDIDKLEDTTPAAAVEDKAQIDQQTILAAEKRIGLAVKEERYDDMLVLVDELLTLYTEIFTQELDTSDITPQSVELVHSIFETFHSMAKTFSLVMTHKPEEAIEVASLAIEKIQILKRDFTTVGELDGMDSALLQLRSAAYLYTGQKELAIADLKSLVTEEFLSVLFIRALEQKLGTPILPAFEVTQAEFEDMGTPEKIEFSLMNGNHYRALDLLESEKLSWNYPDSFLELKVLALSMRGSHSEALEAYELLRSHSDEEDLDQEVLALILFMKGDIRQASELCIDSGQFAVLPILQYFEQ